MKIVSLVENTSKSDLKARHGLSLYIETKSHKILFDLGPDKTLFDNAAKRSIDLSEIDTVVISHGHVDHGGALKKFLNVNTKARVYVQKEAFESHYSRFLLFKIPIGLNQSLKNNKQIILLEGNHKIDDELFLFTLTMPTEFCSPVNGVLYDVNGKDTFKHEQNLIISENENVLIMGCGHCGVVNIMKVAERCQPSLCVGGFHLFNPFTKKTVPKEFLDEIAVMLQKYGEIKFYTCHCTGKKAFNYLSQRVNNLYYLSCGESIMV